MEALHLAHGLVALEELGILDALPATAATLAKRHDLDETLLRGTLEYAAARSNLVEKRGDMFEPTRHYAHGARFLLDLYGLAYGSTAARLARTLRDPSSAGRSVKRVGLARAFACTPGASPLGGIVRQLELNYVLDLGCGNGQLLQELAGQDPAFVGWGLERNPAACSAARSNLRGTNVRIFRGNAERVGAAIPAAIRKQVRVITASQLLNELLMPDARAVRCLRALRRAFPGRPVLISDYYGRLGRGPLDRETWLHDFVQLASGQGVPPADYPGWQALYEQAGYALAQVIEDVGTTLFVHLVV